jgi:hypothetical protein
VLREPKLIGGEELIEVQVQDSAEHRHRSTTPSRRYSQPAFAEREMGAQVTSQAQQTPWSTMAWSR